MTGRIEKEGKAVILAAFYLRLPCNNIQIYPMSRRIGKVWSDIVPIVRLENMNLMGSLIIAFAKIAPARYSKFSEIFITYA